MTAQTKSRPGSHREAASKTTQQPNHSKKTRLALLCPCCGGEVTHRRYGFDMIIVAPMRTARWYVCDECESVLTGTDDAARRIAERAFVAFLDGSDHAPTT